MLRYILYVVSRSNGRIWTGCRFHSLSSSPQMQAKRKNVPSRRKTQNTFEHVEPDDGQTKSGTKRPIGTFDTIAQPMRYEKSLRILQWHQKSPAIFARRKYVLCTFIHQKVRHDFGSIDLDHKPQAKQAPRDPSPWYCIHIMLTVTARYMIRSLQRHSGLFTTTRIGNRMLGYC